MAIAKKPLLIINHILPGLFHHLPKKVLKWKNNLGKFTTTQKTVKHVMELFAKIIVNAFNILTKKLYHRFSTGLFNVLNFFSLLFIGGGWDGGWGRMIWGEGVGEIKTNEKYIMLPRLMYTPCNLKVCVILKMCFFSSIQNFLINTFL